MEVIYASTSQVVWHKKREKPEEPVIVSYFKKMHIVVKRYVGKSFGTCFLHAYKVNNTEKIHQFMWKTSTFYAVT